MTRQEMIDRISQQAERELIALNSYTSDEILWMIENKRKELARVPTKVLAWCVEGKQAEVGHD